jgi:hypothetical protein
MRGEMMLPAALLALFWGMGYALFLWGTGPGRFLRLRRTWLSVVIGVGVDLLIGLLVVDVRVWAGLAGVVSCSAVGIVVAALSGEYREHREELGEAQARGR